MNTNSTKTANTVTEQDGVIWLWLSRLHSASLVAFCFTLLATTLVVLISTIIYRLYIHPLRKVPGPRLAALTDVYGFYWNWVGEGYCKLFNPLHQKYNSHIVRIGPNHVHVDQPEFFDEAFKAGSAWLKDASFYKYFGGVDTMIEPIEYRTYRTHLAPLYSQRSIDRLVPKLHQCLMMAGEQMFASSGQGKAVNMTSILRTLSADMILHIIFSQDISLSDYDGYHPFLESCDVLMRYTWMMLNYPLVAMVLGIIPGTGFAKLTSAFNGFMKQCENWVNEDVRIINSKAVEPGRDSHMTRYLGIDSSNGAKKKFIPYPLEDIFNFVAGGSDTTSYTTACALFYVLSSPDVLSKLVSELDEASPFIRDEFDYKRIQNLPYLNAVINETLRISSPVPGCNPRVVPKGGTIVDSIYLPAGTVVSISQLAIHQNEKIFPMPEKFIPERWLGEEGKLVKKWNVAFSRGPRQCMGMTLAYLEMRCCLAYFLSRFELTLTGECGDQLRWVDRFVATNLDSINVNVIRDRWA